MLQDAWLEMKNRKPGVWLKWTGCDAGSVPEILENFSSAFLLGAFECTCSVILLPSATLSVRCLVHLCEFLPFVQFIFFFFFLSNVKRQCFKRQVPDLFGKHPNTTRYCEHEEACKRIFLLFFPWNFDSGLYEVHWAFVDHVKNLTCLCEWLTLALCS